MGIQRVNQRLGIHRGTTTDVNKDRLIFHLVKECRIKEMPGLSGQRHNVDYKVRLSSFDCTGFVSHNPVKMSSGTAMATNADRRDPEGFELLSNPLANMSSPKNDNRAIRQCVDLVANLIANPFVFTASRMTGHDATGK